MTSNSFIEPTDAYPSGIIIPFFDDTVPDGWVLCDGNNGTPDLRSRFVKSVPDSSTTPGTTGGQDTVTMSEAQLPSHTHGGSTGDSGYHEHEVGYRSEPGSYGSDDFGKSLASNGSHSHSTFSIGNEGADAGIDNRPKYVKTTFIQKI